MCPIISSVQIQLTEYQPYFMGPSTLYELNGLMSLTNWGGGFLLLPALFSPALSLLVWDLVPMLNSSFSVTTSALGRMVGGGHLVSG